ncbi:MAG TPA: lactate utilization protein [Pyrinomonadaceae bacterium]|nr:lactate utilization protein [Pyrinomonadaceae bacterium]
MSTNKEKILARVRAANNRAGLSRPHEPLPEYVGGLESIRAEDLADRFCAELQSVAGFCRQAQSDEEIGDYLTSLLPRDAGKPVVALNHTVRASHPQIVEQLTRQNVSLLYPPPSESAASAAGPGAESPSRDSRAAHLTDEYRRHLLDAVIGVTTADYAIADTGTLVLLTGGEQHRLLSLLPLVHVCLLDAGRIVASLSHLLNHARPKFNADATPPQAMTFITGPSRTADVEQTISMGVHGPHQVHVIIHQTRSPAQ